MRIMVMRAAKETRRAAAWQPPPERLGKIRYAVTVRAAKETRRAAAWQPPPERLGKTRYAVTVRTAVMRVMMMRAVRKPGAAQLS